MRSSIASWTFSVVVRVSRIWARRFTPRSVVSSPSFNKSSKRRWSVSSRTIGSVSCSAYGSRRAIAATAPAAAPRTSTAAVASREGFRGGVLRFEAVFRLEEVRIAVRFALVLFRGLLFAGPRFLLAARLATLTPPLALSYLYRQREARPGRQLMPTGFARTSGLPRQARPDQSAS